MNYQKVDSIPVVAIEDYFEEVTLNNWRNQGLPQDKTAIEFLEMDAFTYVPVSFWPIPVFEHRILFEDEKTLIEIDDLGCTVKRDKKAPNMFYGIVKHPIKNMDDWKRYKERFNFEIERYSCKNRMDWENELADKLKQVDKSENPVVLNIYPHFMRLGFYGMGMESFMTAFYDMPELIHDMFLFWSEFIIKLLHPILGKVKIDMVSILEDLAYKQGPHFSPKFYKEFWLPYQTPIIEEIKKSGTHCINMISSGNIDVLLPMMMKNGINSTSPVDRNSNMDPIRLRKEYGKELRLIGGISKYTLFEGPDAIDREIERIMPLIEEGGFIPALDDVVPPETPFKHYVYFIEKLKSIRL